ncbi:MAG TPA: TspO/MBR family protein [Kofleriaceae bacterium]|nr:TspO/MBR family protein [Kofleriaceae bacterium]
MLGAITGAAALIGNLATRRSVDSRWYRDELKKPSFQPPRGAFGPVWTGLYAAMARSAARVWRAPPSPERTRALALWGTQLGLNAAWSVLFFGLRRPRWALVEVGVLLAAIAAYAAAAARVDRRAAALMAPYLAWTGFATVLNGTIVAQNEPRVLAPHVN